MSYFTAVVQQNEEKSFNLHFPDIDGCTATSDNMQTLTKYAVDELTSYFADREAFTPRSLAEISSDPQVKESLKNGATLILVPLRIKIN